MMTNGLIIIAINNDHMKEKEIPPHENSHAR
jgi:hypothetical protein